MKLPSLAEILVGLEGSVVEVTNVKPGILCHFRFREVNFGHWAA